MKKDINNVILLLLAIIDMTVKNIIYWSYYRLAQFYLNWTFSPVNIYLPWMYNNIFSYQKLYTYDIFTFICFKSITFQVIFFD